MAAILVDFNKFYATDVAAFRNSGGQVVRLDPDHFALVRRPGAARPP